MHVLVPEGHPAWSFAAHLKRGDLTEAIVWPYGERDVFKLVNGTLGAECVFLWLEPELCAERADDERGRKPGDGKKKSGNQKRNDGK